MSQTKVLTYACTDRGRELRHHYLAGFLFIFNNSLNLVPIGLLLGGVDFSNRFVVLKAADPAVTMNYGLFINAIISFLITAFALFLIIKAANRLQPEEKEETPLPAPTTKQCPYCYTEIPIPATRCPHCTSDLGE